ncbi:MAG: leucyl/phenylalanyl-tRNA--protein transferase [Bacteriovoracaceae bacterium]|nr:leucyl/phenylalanyl-tRNA--protein transferase [Bacteriovoracaceae bacterium]
MPIIEFPPVESATEDGLLAIGGDLEIPSLVLAYTQGIFPWPISSTYPLAWFSPNPRGILFYKDLYISRSLKKAFNKSDHFISVDTCFDEVISRCANSGNRKLEGGTWITDEIQSAFRLFHRAGYAHSVEVKDEGGKLIGGLYGVFMKGVFSGESMFFESDNASKFALIWVMEFLYQNGIEWMDTQMVTPVVKSLGGSEYPRENYIELLGIARQGSVKDPFTEKKRAINK